MLTQIFAVVFRMSLTAGAVILWVLAARFLLRGAPKVLSMALWGVVLFRLLCPVSIPSRLSLLGLGGTVVQADAAPAAVEQLVPRREAEGPAAVPTAQAAGTETDVFAGVWLAGVGAMALWGGCSDLTLRRKLREAIPEGGNVYRSDRIDSPFVLGVLAPKIYLPAGLEDGERDYILVHERCHIGRMDHVTKALAYLALTIHWFNPLVWAAFLLAGRDMEMSCDEAVVKKLGPQVRADYSASLLRLAVGRRAAVPLAFADGDPGKRIRNLARWKKPTAKVAALGGVVCLLLGCGLATDPAEPEKSVPESGRQAEIIANLTDGGEDFLWPLPGYTDCSVRFGERHVHPVTGKEIVHAGVDVPAPKGTPVLSVKTGVVVRAEYSPAEGNCVEVAHSDGTTVRYAHLSRMAVEKGQPVARGDTLGTVGNTGMSTGAHLHLEMRSGDKLVDPMGLFAG